MLLRSLFRSPLSSRLNWTALGRPLRGYTYEYEYEYEKRDGKWLIVSHHSSLLPAAG